MIFVADKEVGLERTPDAQHREGSRHRRRMIPGFGLWCSDGHLYFSRSREVYVGLFAPNAVANDRDALVLVLARFPLVRRMLESQTHSFVRIESVVPSAPYALLPCFEPSMRD